MLHPIQEKLLELSKKVNLGEISLREMAAAIGISESSPQKIKHHLVQLQNKGFIQVDRQAGTMKRSYMTAIKENDFLKKGSHLFSIPILGMANCGPAEIEAVQHFEGYLHASSRLLGRSKPDGLFALKTDGSSMNRTRINGQSIDSGDYVIVNSEDKNVQNNDVVVAVIDGRATIKRFIDDRENGRVILKSDSSYDYAPIYLHAEDELSISGKVVAVIKK